MLRKLIFAAAAVMAVTLVAGAAAGGPPTARYRVTIENLSGEQPLSPPVAATHNKSLRMFRVGRPASDELAAIAQAGDQGPMFALVSGAGAVTDAVDVGRPLTRSGTVVGDFTDSATFELDAEPGDVLSLATMLICTNDGFTGLDAVKLPKAGSLTWLTAGYDAGRERNTQDSEDIVDPCSALGPAPLAGDPNGNVDTGVVAEDGRIAHHPGITAEGDLSPALHGWDDPVARVTVERIG